MNRYTICNRPDEDIYRRQCAALEKHIPSVVSVNELANVDGGFIHVYQKGGAMLVVKNDFYTGGVFIDSDIELTEFF